jgi:hypothetical protein
MNRKSRGACCLRRRRSLPGLRAGEPRPPATGATRRPPVSPHEYNLVDQPLASLHSQRPPGKTSTSRSLASAHLPQRLTVSSAKYSERQDIPSSSASIAVHPWVLSSEAPRHFQLWKELQNRRGKLLIK